MEKQSSEPENKEAGLELRSQQPGPGLTPTEAQTVGHFLFKRVKAWRNASLRTQPTPKEIAQSRAPDSAFGNTYPISTEIVEHGGRKKEYDGDGQKPKLNLPDSPTVKPLPSSEEKTVTEDDVQTKELDEGGRIAQMRSPDSPIGKPLRSPKKEEVAKHGSPKEETGGGCRTAELNSPDSAIAKPHPSPKAAVVFKDKNAKDSDKGSPKPDPMPPPRKTLFESPGKHQSKVSATQETWRKRPSVNSPSEAWAPPPHQDDWDPEKDDKIDMNSVEQGKKKIQIRPDPNKAGDGGVDKTALELGTAFMKMLAKAENPADLLRTKYSPSRKRLPIFEEITREGSGANNLDSTAESDGTTKEANKSDSGPPQ